MPRVPTLVPAEAGVDAACQGGVPWGRRLGRRARASGRGSDSVHLSPCPVSNRSPHPQSTHGVPRNVDELSSLQSSSDTSSSRPGSRVPTEPPATSVASRGSSLPSSRWGRPEAHRRAEARPRLRNTGWTCQECQEWVPDRENYVSHMKKSHGRVSVLPWSQGSARVSGLLSCGVRAPYVADPLGFPVLWAGWVPPILRSFCLHHPSRKSHPGRSYSSDALCPVASRRR